VCGGIKLGQAIAANLQASPNLYWVLVTDSTEKGKRAFDGLRTRGATKMGLDEGLLAFGPMAPQLGKPGQIGPWSWDAKKPENYWPSRFTRRSSTHLSGRSVGKFGEAAGPSQGRAKS